jgi:hypothetical protein
VKKPRKLQGNPRLSKDGVIKNWGFEQLCSEIEEDDDAHPDDVRAAVRRVHQSLTYSFAGIAPVPLNPSESAFLCLVFGRYLDDGRKLSLDQAFGLAKARRGNPGTPRRKRLEIACALMEQFITTKDSLKFAAGVVGDRFGKVPSRVLELLDANFLSASARIALRRRKTHPDRVFTGLESLRFGVLYRRNYKKNSRLQATLSRKSAQ